MVTMDNGVVWATAGTVLLTVVMDAASAEIISPRPPDDTQTGGNSTQPDRGSGGIGSNGGFIAVVAAASVVLPLSIVLAIQLRNSKKRQRQREHEAREAAEVSARAEAAARNADSPPAYNELFAPSESVSVSSNSSENSGGVGTNDERRDSGSRLMGSAVRASRERNQVTEHRSSHVSSVMSFLSSSIASTLQTGSAPSPGSSSGDVSVVSSGTSRSTDARSTPAGIAVISSSDTNVRRESSSSSSSSSRSDLSHSDPPPAYHWSGHGSSGHVTVVVPAENDNTSERSLINSSDSSVTSQPSLSSNSQNQRRFVGMHLSIVDLMAVFNPDPNPTPPPTYDDALKMLESISQQTEIRVM